MTDMSKFMKLQLKKSTARSTGELSADEVFGKMTTAEIKLQSHSNISLTH